jgi:hypothetical protein
MKASHLVAATTAMLLAAAFPAVAQQQQVPSAAAAPAQQGQMQMSDTMVTKVGTALRHVTLIRRQYSQQAQAASTPQQKQTLSEQARGDMIKAISDQGLSVQQYDQAIRMAQHDDTLKQRLLSVAQAGQ